VVEYEGRELFEVDILPDFETGNENINLEFDTLIAAIPEEPYGNRSCYYHLEGKPCAFCILGEKKIDLGPPYLVQAYEAIRNEAAREPQVLLTGGTESAEDRGLAKYIPYIEELKGRFKEARIAIEAAPPMNTSCLDPLIDLGMDTFAANMEFYSPECRDRLLPGKSSIPLDDYRNVLTYCNDAGVKTFSAVIAGPESETDTLNGVRFLAELGVPTNLLCVRPFPGASLENHPRVNPAWFLQLTKKAVRIMDEYGVLESLASTAGCGSCGACAMEMNFYRLMKNGQAENMLDLL
jgi:hypothetical protein